MPCKTVLGDRDIAITNKRYQAKIHLLELYKEELAAKKAKEQNTEKTNG